MKLQRSISIRNSSLEEITRWIDFSLSDISEVINGKVSFGDNLDGNLVPVSFASSGVEVQVAHGLNRVPQGYLSTRASAPVVVYDGSTGWTIDNIYVKANGAGNVTLFVF